MGGDRRAADVPGLADERLDQNFSEERDLNALTETPTMPEAGDSPHGHFAMEWRDPNRVPQARFPWDGLLSFWIFRMGRKPSRQRL